MNVMRKHRTKILFGISVALILAALLLDTDKGQVLLRGTIPANATPFERDDIYMGAGLTPIVYGGGLAIIFFVAGIVSWACNRNRAPDLR